MVDNQSTMSKTLFVKQRPEKMNIQENNLSKDIKPLNIDLNQPDAGKTLESTIPARKLAKETQKLLGNPEEPLVPSQINKKSQGIHPHNVRLGWRPPIHKARKKQPIELEHEDEMVNEQVINEQITKQEIKIAQTATAVIEEQPPLNEDLEEAQQQYRQSFERMRLFSGVPSKVVERLYAKASIQQVYAGHKLYDEHDRPDDIYFLVKGSVKVAHSASDGREVVSSLQKAPVSLGDTEFFADISAVGKVEALERCTVFAVPKEEFGMAVHESPILVKNLIKEQACHTVDAIREQQFTALNRVEARLAKLLNDYVEKWGLRVADGYKIRIKLSQNDLANSLGVNPRSILRTLAEWADAHILTKKDGFYTVHDLDALQAIKGIA